MNNIENVWIFSGKDSRFPSGVFLSLDLAEEWINQHGLTGVLTSYPVNTGIYDWAISKGYFTPKKEEHHQPAFIQKFSSASQDHYHYENGKRD